MLPFRPKTRRARAGPSGRCSYIGSDERAGRDYFLSDPHVFYDVVRSSTPPAAPPPSGAGARRGASSPCAPLAAYNRLTKSQRHPTEG